MSTTQTGTTQESTTQDSTTPATTPNLPGAGFGATTTAAEVVAGVDLTGRRAVVTGGASGIGVETARALASAGAEVTLAVRDLDAGRRTALEIEAGDVRVAHLDLADQASVHRSWGPGAAHWTSWSTTPG